MKTKLALTSVLGICIQLTGAEPGTLLGVHKAALPRESDHHLVSDHTSQDRGLLSSCHFANGAMSGALSGGKQGSFEDGPLPDGTYN